MQDPKTPVALSSYSPSCTRCVHFIGQKGKMTCRAYPDGIPQRHKGMDPLHLSVQGDQVGTYVYERQAQVL